MKKLLKTFVIFALMICTCITFVACKNDDDKDEQQVATEVALDVLKTSVGQMSSASQNNSSFTIIDYTTDNSTSKVNESMFSPEGWSEEYTKSVIEALNCIGTNENSKQKAILSYDSQNKTGYEVFYSTKDKTEIVDEYRVLENEGDKFYLYDYLLDRHENDALKEKEKFCADGEYFNNYLADLCDFVEDVQGFTDSKSLNDLQKVVLDNIDTGIENFKTNCNINMSATLIDNVYMLKIHGSYYSNSAIMDSEEYSNLSISFDVIFMFEQNNFKSIEIKNTMQATLTISENLEDDDGNSSDVLIPINMNITQNCKQEFTGLYNDAYKPNLSAEEKETFVDCGNVSIDIYYYINNYSSSYFATKSLGESCDDIGIADLENAKDIVWYIDRECTKPFTNTTYPSYNLHLYSKDVKPVEGKAFLFDEYISSENEMHDYVYGIRIVDINFGKLDAGSYEYAYLNGTRIEAGEDIVLDNTIVNILYYIRKAETY